MATKKVKIERIHTKLGERTVCPNCGKLMNWWHYYNKYGKAGAWECTKKCDGQVYVKDGDFWVKAKLSRGRLTK